MVQRKEVSVPTYSFAKRGAGSLAKELLALYRSQNRNFAGQVEFLALCMEQCEARVHALAGIELRGLDTLVIGAGQKLREILYLAGRNRVTGIDMDVIPAGFDPLAYWRMLRANGPLRTLKTATRRALGIDRKFQNQLRIHMGIDRFAPFELKVMDATKMTFPDDSFDFIYSFSVFEHIDRPQAAMDEIARVLRPGGVCYLSLHLFTSANGHHDFRGAGDEPLAAWAHLRPQFQNQVRPNAYLNRIRLCEWETMFRASMGGVEFFHDTHLEQELPPHAAALQQLRAAGELEDYSDQELMTVNQVAVWQKPAESNR
jgi:SAM-dependent methyltransferase